MINFKRISAIATSLLMVGMTAGVAAAATYPNPFVTNNVANVAIVYGANSPSSLDLVPATSIQTDLGTYMTATGTGTATATGDNVHLTKSSDKLNLNDAIDLVWTAAVTDSNLPVLLADGIYTNDENTEYAYDQKVQFSNGMNFTQFADSDYLDKKSSLGFYLASGKFILNYTFDWTTSPESDVTGGDLVDIETTNIKLLGREYYILDMDNATSDMTLLDAASSTILSEGETTSVTVGDKTYKVGINFIGTTSVKLDVDGSVTNSLSAGGTQRLSDGAYVGVKEINVQDYAGGIKNVEFSIGKGKLEIKGGGTAAATGLADCSTSSIIELNDVSVDDISSCVDRTGASGGKEKLDKIVLTWKSEDEAFLTPTQELLMPGFGALKFTMGQIVFPKAEETEVDYSGDDVIEITTTIKDGAITLPILYGTTNNWSHIGKAADERLETGNGSRFIVYQAQSGYNEGFIATWNNSKEGESYYLQASVSRDSSGSYINRTTIKNKLTGQEICKDLQAGDVCTIGNVELNIDKVDYQTSSNRNVSIHITDGSFNRMITKEGLTIWLPWDVAKYEYAGCPAASRGAINLTANATARITYAVSGYGSDGYTLWFADEDKDETLGAGNLFNMTIQHTGTTTRATVNAIQFEGASSTGIETERSSDIYDIWMYDELATEILWDKTNSDQYSAKVIYHGDEVGVDVFLSSPSSVVTSAGTTTLGEVIIKDSEAAGNTKNLIIVGGSCVNTVAANLVGGAKCTTAWETATGVGAGKYLIQSYQSPYSTSAIAVLVAGYEAADTVNAQKALTTNKPDVTIGKKWTGTTASDMKAA